MPANSSTLRLPVPVLTLASPEGTQLSRDQGAGRGYWEDTGFGEQGKVGLVRGKRSPLTDKVPSCRTGSCFKRAGTVINTSDNWLCQEQLLRATTVSGLARTDSASHYTLERFDINAL